MEASPNRYTGSRGRHTSLVIDDRRGDAWSSLQDGQEERYAERVCMDPRIARIGAIDAVCSGVHMAGSVQDGAGGFVVRAWHRLEGTPVGTEAARRASEECYYAYWASCTGRDGVCDYDGACGRLAHHHWVRNAC